MDFTPADAHFCDWFHYWQRKQTGIATVQDLILARMSWEMSFALQVKLGTITD